MVLRQASGRQPGGLGGQPYVHHTSPWYEGPATPPGPSEVTMNWYTLVSWADLKPAAFQVMHVSEKVFELLTAPEAEICEERDAACE